jgi:hypothetical protein
MWDIKGQMRCDREVGVPGKVWSVCGKVATVAIESRVFFGMILHYCRDCAERRAGK